MEIVNGALGLVGTITVLIQQALAARAAGQVEQAAAIEKQLAQATADWAHEHGALPAALAKKDAETLAVLDVIDKGKIP